MKLKLRKIGNSQGVYLPKSMVGNYKIGDLIDLEVITEVITGEIITPVITEKGEIKDALSNIVTPHKNINAGQWCKTHDTYKGTCGCN